MGCGRALGAGGRRVISQVAEEVNCREGGGECDLTPERGQQWERTRGHRVRSGSYGPSSTVPSPLSHAPGPLSHHILIFKTQQGRLLRVGPTHLGERGGDRRPPTCRVPSLPAPLAPHSPGPRNRAPPPTRSAAARPRCPAYSAPG